MYKFKDIHLDDETMWPTSPKIELEEPFEDDRGYIQSLLNFPMKNLSMIFHWWRKNHFTSLKFLQLYRLITSMRSVVIIK